MAKKIILVHGLGGTADKTWGKFPDFLEKDPDLDFSIISYGYESPNVFLQFYKSAPSILNIANGLLTDIKARCDLDNDEIILAGHSLGGLVIKKLLLRMKDKKIKHNIRKVCFFDVPHDGSGFANVGKYIAFRNKHLRDLCRDSSELDDLNDQWVDSELDNSLDILSVITANDDIVSSLSSKSIFRNHRVETINNANHKTIVKPESMDSSSYIVFKKFILEKSTIIRFKSNASRDINDWISIERNHNYPFVSDERRDKDFQSLIEALKLDRAVIRLTGASGLGKTRLLLEAIEISPSIDETCVLIFNAPGYEKEIKETIRSAVETKVSGLAVVENCNVDLHNELAKEVNKTECFLKVVSMGYSHDRVDASIEIKLSPLSDDTIKQILSPILVGLDSGDVDRVARFAQGYPLMATLIAEQYQREGRLLGSIEDRTVVRKLIEGDSDVSDNEKDVLSACSLFDVFGTAEGAAGEEARFIAETVAESSLKIFDRVVRIFSARQIIHRAGRYARVIPKPLALTLASDWWEETSYDRQKHLIEHLPDSLMQSFSIQASYLDSQPSVQRFSEKLFGGQSPFVQAGELLTERGSKLFREFVEVNPESTSNALYRILKEMTRDELFRIEGDTRRNLVWGLEKLCFHADVFEKSSWCLLLLASAENETWSNNATGMFAQLFRVYLSGTEAAPNIRFDVLKRAIGLNQLEIDMVVLEALSQSISTYGGTRMVGAEFQGTKAPLVEWRPDLWQEVFDFWQNAFDLLLVLFERNEPQKNKVLSEIGYSIRGFVHQRRIEMLDSAIKHIVSINGPYWPAALESIKNIFEYDSEEMDENTVDALNNWLEILKPDDANLADKIKIIVINPPFEHREENGNYIDVASEKAKALGIEVAKDIDSLIPHLGLLLQGEQKESYSFGYQLALELDDISQLVERSLEKFIVVNHANPNFIRGIFRGIYEKSAEKWQENIEFILADERLISLYPDLICTGDIQKSHLDKLLELIRCEILSPDNANVLSYGSVTRGIDPKIFMTFCLSLSELGNGASLSALRIIYMYCYGNKESIEILREPLKQLILRVPLHKKEHRNTTDMHRWQDLAKKLLKKPDKEFAIALTNQLIEACHVGLDYSDIWNYYKPLLFKIMNEYGDFIWPIFGNAIVKAKGLEQWWLSQLLKSENSFSRQKPSVLSVLPVRTVISWCDENPELGPYFIARNINILDNVDEELKPSEFFIELLVHFGNDERVANALEANMGTRGWSGSLVPYLEADKEALLPLLEHENENVRLWTKNHISNINRQIEAESIRDEEKDIGIF